MAQNPSTATPAPGFTELPTEEAKVNVSPSIQMELEIWKAVQAGLFGLASKKRHIAPLPHPQQLAFSLRDTFMVT